MLIDDSEIDNFINLKMIESCHFAENVHVYSSGKSALEYLKNMERSKGTFNSSVPELIFLDINMPGLDGFQFADEFEKLDAQFRAGIKIIVLTSSINPEDSKKSKQFPGIIDFITKPLTQTALMAIKNG